MENQLLRILPNTGDGFIVLESVTVVPDGKYLEMPNQYSSLTVVRNANNDWVVTNIVGAINQQP